MSTQDLGATGGSVVADGEDPLDMKELWDSVTEGSFDNLNIDIVFGVAFVVIVRSRAGSFTATHTRTSCKANSTNLARASDATL